MAKSMALIDDGIVVNVLWCSDNAKSTDSLIDIADRPVGIGDTYADGKFYRAGVEVLPPGQLKKTLTGDIISILANYGLVVQ